jgi:hypothetical protein
VSPSASLYVQKNVREWPTMIGQPQVGMALAAETRIPQPLSTGAAWPLHTPGLAYERHPQLNLMAAIRKEVLQRKLKCAR